jgi:hypothetical protein
VLRQLPARGSADTQTRVSRSSFAHAQIKEREGQGGREREGEKGKQRERNNECAIERERERESDQEREKERVRTRCPVSDVLRCVWRALDVDAAASVELGTATGGCVSLLPCRRLRVMVVHPCRLRLLVAVSVDITGFDARLLARPPSCHVAGGQWTWMLLCRSSVQLQRLAASPHSPTVGSVRWSCFCFGSSLSSPPRFVRLGPTLVSLLGRRTVIKRLRHIFGSRRSFLGGPRPPAAGRRAPRGAARCARAPGPPPHIPPPLPPPPG